MNILVTGGCGYVGSVLTPKLLNQGHTVNIYDIMWFGNFLKEHKNLKIIQGDIRDINAIPMEGIDAIIHLANIANDPCGDLNSKLSWEVNVLATMGMVEKAIANKIKQFILSSSGSVYGVKEEPQVTEELPLVPISDYNKTKMVSERVLLSYKDKIIIQIVRPATVCGYSPRMRLDLSVNMLAVQALANGKITVTALASVTTPFTGKGNLATVNFTVKSDAPTGLTQVNFDFDPNDKTKTSDSTVVQRSTVKDILNSVVNGSYTIGSGACSAGAPPQGGIGTPSGAVSSPSAVPSQTLPPAGSQDLTYALAIVGSILTILGILGLAFL